VAGLVRRQIYSESVEDKEVMKSLMELALERPEQLDHILGQLGQSGREVAVIRMLALGLV
jgi:hypothetical protein